VNPVQKTMPWRFLMWEKFVDFDPMPGRGRP
jgi:hypothetical protein